MKAILQRDYFDWLFKIPGEEINVQEASQCNWKSLLALHIFLSFMAHCVKVIFLGQDDVDVKEPCSKQKGWDLTAAAEVLNCLTWRGLTTAGGYRRCRHSSPRCVSLPSYPLFGFLGFFFCLLRKIPYFKQPSQI